MKEADYIMTEEDCIRDLSSRLVQELRAKGYQFYFSNIMDDPTYVELYLGKGHYFVREPVSIYFCQNSMTYIIEKVDILKKHLDEMMAENHYLTDEKWDGRVWR